MDTESRRSDARADTVFQDDGLYARFRRKLHPELPLHADSDARWYCSITFNILTDVGGRNIQSHGCVPWVVRTDESWAWNEPIYEKLWRPGILSSQPWVQHRCYAYWILPNFSGSGRKSVTKCERFLQSDKSRVQPNKPGVQSIVSEFLSKLSGVQSHVTAVLTCVPCVCHRRGRLVFTE